ncbi:molybdate ABC transporter ATP-binding protein [Catenovulum agarivorans DS-2]|uniref:Molybdate ABC transporter ATP-binding protein n=1 Tax=Catenovulum agarivorans DS-2 TaxID=1328313 RepID=W7QXB8_9ALTE|nr:molybdenum ABC transporter ATP-binding protein [Catenovulum agarivorans]EWH12368.1 molybdate ABC transporter ATP-binding protein [Catenovulum agarivorans DS-2]
MAEFNDSYFSFSGRLNQFEFSMSASLPRQGLTAIWGPSGCGKSTLLRCIAGLQPQVTGRLTIMGRNFQTQNSFIPVHKRDIGYVFQNGALFEHLNVHENLLFGLRKKNNRAGNQAVKFHYDELVELMGLAPLVNRRTNKLSGGERQRVAIARALLSQPHLLLMDEPLAALDQHNKNNLLNLIEKIKETLSIPIIYVSHDIAEICRLADHILVIDQGQVIDQGTINQVFAKSSKLPWLQEQIGVVLDGVITTELPEENLVKINVAANAFLLPATNLSKNQKNVRLRILAKDVSLSLSADNQSSIVNRMPMQISDIEQSAGESIVHVHLVSTAQGAEFKLVASVTRYSWNRLALAIGCKVFAQVKAVSIIS